MGEENCEENHSRTQIEEKKKKRPNWTSSFAKHFEDRSQSLLMKHVKRPLWGLLRTPSQGSINEPLPMLGLISYPT
jgi:hypothetical protein